MNYVNKNFSKNLKTNFSMYKEQLKFYADTPKGERNKLFCFNVGLLQIEEAYFRFIARGWEIRAAWYQKTNLETGVVENLRLNIDSLNEKFIMLPVSKIKSFQVEQNIFTQPKQS